MKILHPVIPAPGGLDYVASYQCKVQSTAKGHDLSVLAGLVYDTVIRASLLNVDVADSAAKRTYHYLINTKGGSISISSKGADGRNGFDGMDGYNGARGTDGIISSSIVTTIAPDGSTQSSTITTQGAGWPGWVRWRRRCPR